MYLIDEVCLDNFCYLYLSWYSYYKETIHLSLVWLTFAYNYDAHICFHVCVNKKTCHYVHVLQDGQGKVSSNHISLFAAGHESSDWELSNAATQPVANEIVLVINESNRIPPMMLSKAFAIENFEWPAMDIGRTNWRNATQLKLNNILEKYWIAAIFYSVI